MTRIFKIFKERRPLLVALLFSLLGLFLLVVFFSATRMPMTGLVLFVFGLLTLGLAMTWVDDLKHGLLVALAQVAAGFLWLFAVSALVVQDEVAVGRMALLFGFWMFAAIGRLISGDGSWQGNIRSLAFLLLLSPPLAGASSTLPNDPWWWETAKLHAPTAGYFLLLIGSLWASFRLGDLLTMENLKLWRNSFQKLRTT